MKKRILVTGGAGFLGSYLYCKEELVKQCLPYSRMCIQEKAHPFTWIFTDTVLAE